MLIISIRMRWKKKWSLYKSSLKTGWYEFHVRLMQRLFTWDSFYIQAAQFKPKTSSAFDITKSYLGRVSKNWSILGENKLLPRTLCLWKMWNFCHYLLIVIKMYNYILSFSNWSLPSNTHTKKKQPVVIKYLRPAAFGAVISVAC